MKDKCEYLSKHDPLNQEKLDLCEQVFSTCSFDKCKYSIVIPEYRRPVMAKEAMLSALGQDYPEEYEVLLTSDGQFP